MPELPEVEIAARRLDASCAGARVESALAPGMVTMKTFDPPLDALAGREIGAVRRRGKMFVVELGGLSLLIHLMSAGRLQAWDKRASLRDKASRLLLRLDGDRELRLREFGTQQRAWAKLLPSDAIESDPDVAKLGPDAWPELDAGVFTELMSTSNRLHPLLRDQRTIAGIGRSWVDEILWTAKLSPFKAAADLTEEQRDDLRRACAERLGGALEHYEEVIGATVPDKLPMPLEVHRRDGEACPRCGDTIAAIHFKDYVMCYCPTEQTGGKVLKDRRLSKLLK